MIRRSRRAVGPSAVVACTSCSASSKLSDFGTVRRTVCCKLNPSYDQFGNVTQLAKVIGTTTYPTGYAYNLANKITQITYPSGRVVQQNVDTIGRLSSVVGTLNTVNTTYASGFAYSAAQQVTGFNYGNNINAAFGYSADRLQLNCLDYSTTNRNGVCAHDATTKFGL